MEEKEKFCPICGNRIVGRSDKIYCTTECRTFANNKKQREMKLNQKSNKYYKEINASLVYLSYSDKIIYAKIIYYVTQICRIIYNFGTLKIKNKKK